MNISKEDLTRINKGFGSNLRNDAGIDFAIEMQRNRKIGLYKKLAYLWRAILVDHPFSDGNKRTALFVAFKFAEEANKKANRDLLIHYIQSIASRNITNIKNIEWRIKTAIK